MAQNARTPGDVGDGPVLLYDGTCGFCARSVQFLLRHERGRRSLHFARLEGSFGRQVTAGSTPPETDSMLWLEAGGDRGPATPLTQSAATIAALRYLGGGWAVLGTLLAAVPRVVRDAGYAFVARHRHRIAGGPTCVIPTDEQRERFLDDAD